MPAPTPDAIEELTRPDSRVLLLGEDFERLRALAEALLRIGCRVEIIGLPRPRGSPPLDPYEYRLVVIDTVSISRAAVADVHTLPMRGAPTVVLAIATREDAHPRISFAHRLRASIGRDAQFADESRVAHDILSLWSELRALHGPGDLLIDRAAQRAALGGRPLVLRPFDFRLLRVLVEHGRRGCTPAELCDAGWNGRSVSPERATVGVGRGVQRIRAALRRSNLALVSLANGVYRLTVREPARRTGPFDTSPLDTES